MNITDELRKWASVEVPYKYGHQLLAIADRIDAQHENALLNVHTDLMDANGWVRLTKDADGVYIHEHDRVDWRDHSGVWHKNVLVVAVCNDGCYVIDGLVFHVHASDIRHYHASTVEDVLREFADEVQRCCDTADTIAGYAAKLQLVNGEGE